MMLTDEDLGRIACEGWRWHNGIRWAAPYDDLLENGKARWQNSAQAVVAAVRAEYVARVAAAEALASALYDKSLKADGGCLLCGASLWDSCDRRSHFESSRCELALFLATDPRLATQGAPAPAPAAARAVALERVRVEAAAFMAQLHHWADEIAPDSLSAMPSCNALCRTLHWFTVAQGVPAAASVAPVATGERSSEA